MVLAHNPVDVEAASLYIDIFAEDPIVFSQQEAGMSDSGRHGLSHGLVQEMIFIWSFKLFDIMCQPIRLLQLALGESKSDPMQFPDASMKGDIHLKIYYTKDP